MSDKNKPELFTIDLSECVVPKYTGILHIEHLDKDGNVLHVTHSPNTITYDARTLLTYLLAGQSMSNKYVNALAVGTNGTAPTRNDTALGTQVDTLPVTYTFPQSDRVVFEAILPNSTPANTSTLREAGLFNTDLNMFARQAYGDIYKSSAIQLKYIWTIIFT